MADKSKSDARIINKNYDKYDDMNRPTLLKKKMEASNLKAASK